MKMDILAILMVAFALFAILMFILFYIYAKKYHNEKRISESYEDDFEENDTQDSSNKEIELIDIMINEKDYIFDANNYHLYNNQEVDVIINGNSYHGIVTRSNYIDDLDSFTQIPTKLEIKEPTSDNSVEVEENTLDNDYELEEFVPKKKS